MPGCNSGAVGAPVPARLPGTRRALPLLPCRVAPEVLLGKAHCTSAVDIFSFGVLLWVSAPRCAATLHAAAAGPAAPPPSSPLAAPPQEIVTGDRRVRRGSLYAPKVPEMCPQARVEGWCAGTGRRMLCHDLVGPAAGSPASVPATCHPLTFTDPTFIALCLAGDC